MSNDLVNPNSPSQRRLRQIMKPTWKGNNAAPWGYNKIYNMPPNDVYRENWDKIFGKKNETEKEILDELVFIEKPNDEAKQNE